MLYNEWEPIYAAVLADFGYDRADDERARDLFGKLLTDSDTPSLSVDGIVLEGTIAICGGGPTLSEELSAVRNADGVVAASVAADVCLEAGIEVDCMVTDLDKNPETARKLSRSGTPVAVHSHGDNEAELRRYVPTLDIRAVLPTTQAAPTASVYNPGGFTDGDRGAFLADVCGADRLVFPGWSFDDPSVSPEKARKLRWAERLLRCLETRRNERFSVLDGRRENIDQPW